MILFFFICIAVVIAYAYMLMAITDGWDECKETVPSRNEFSEGVSIIVPARNESQHIKSCVESIINSDTEGIQYEIIVVDDHSDDDTGNIVREAFKEVKVLTLDAAQGKKAATEHGIQSAIHDHCILIDADVTVSSSWLRAHCTIWRDERPKFVAGPVLCPYKEDLLSAFQIMDFLSMAQIIANGIKRRTYHIANGANMAISKKTFIEIGGMKDHQHVASGDDMFLVRKVAEHYPGRIAYLKHPQALVMTNPEQSWSDLFRQRKRWATKTNDLPRDRSYNIQVYTFFIHVLILFNFAITPWTGGQSFFCGLFMLFIKGCIDFLFLSKIGSYFEIRRPFKYFILAFLFYFFYIFFMAFHAVKGGEYQWKGREVK
ncbi:MAG: glycosyltransferase [Saprospiraceae bacterium]|nr:glycosyltransferase [Saprospiraceae bacterium]